MSERHYRILHLVTSIIHTVWLGCLASCALVVMMFGFIEEAAEQGSIPNWSGDVAMGYLFFFVGTTFLGQLVSLGRCPLTLLEDYFLKRADPTHQPRESLLVHCCAKRFGIRLRRRMLFVPLTIVAGTLFIVHITT